MKKIILLLAALALYANAINCLDIKQYYGRFGEYRIDSLQAANGAPSAYWYRHFLYFYTGSNPDSSYYTVGEKHLTTTYKYEFDSARNLEIIRSTYTEDDYVEEDSTYIYIDKDSIVQMNTYMDEVMITSIWTSFRHNDTLYDENYNNRDVETVQLKTKSFTVMDPSDDKKCYTYTTISNGEAYDNGGKTSGKMTLEFEGSTLIAKDYNDYFGDELPDIYFLSIHDEGITGLTRKVQPAITNKQYHYYDLMGRPAKGKNTIKVSK